MTLVSDADLDLVLADWGKPVTTGSFSAVPGLLESAHAAFEGGAGTRADYVTHILRVKPGTLGTPALDQSVTVGGVAFEFRGPVDGPDEVWERWALAKVAQ